MVQEKILMLKTICTHHKKMCNATKEHLFTHLQVRPQFGQERNWSASLKIGVQILQKTCIIKLLYAHKLCCVDFSDNNLSILPS